jgi:hypothetical protein
MLLSRHQNAGQNHDIKIANRCFENVAQEINRRLNSGNAYYHSVQNLLSSHLLSENIKIRIIKIIYLSVVLHGRETLSLTLREEHRLMVFQNKVLTRIFRPTTDEVTGDWRKLHNEERHNLYSAPNITRMIKSRDGHRM